MALLFLNAAVANGQVGAVGDALSEAVCPNANLYGAGLITNICWECLFPIRIAGVSLGSSGNRAPPRAATSPVCFCSDEGLFGKFGVTVGMWQPVRLVEVVRRPYCFPTLGGLQAGPLSTAGGSFNVGRTTGSASGAMSQRSSFQHFHYYAFPLITILGLLDAQECIDGDHADVDLLFFSEAMPTWADDQLAFFLNPEAAMFGNPAASAAMPIECAALSAGASSMDQLFWVSGCWGSNYPLTGNVLGGESPVRAASLTTSRALFLLTRLGFIKRRMGDDAVCRGRRSTVLVKSQFRHQWIYPIPEVRASLSGMTNNQGLWSMPSANPVCCHPIGDTPLKWGEWRTVPVVGEDFVIMIWKWIDCCVGVSL